MPEDDQPPQDEHRIKSSPLKMDAHFGVGSTHGFIMRSLKVELSLKVPDQDPKECKRYQ